MPRLLPLGATGPYGRRTGRRPGATRRWARPAPLPAAGRHRPSVLRISTFARPWQKRPGAVRQIATVARRPTSGGAVRQAGEPMGPGFSKKDAGRRAEGLHGEQGLSKSRPTGGPRPAPCPQQPRSEEQRASFAAARGLSRGSPRSCTRLPPRIPFVAARGSPASPSSHFKALPRVGDARPRCRAGIVEPRLASPIRATRACAPRRVRKRMQGVTHACRPRVCAEALAPSSWYPLLAVGSGRRGRPIAHLYLVASVCRSRGSRICVRILGSV